MPQGHPGLGAAFSSFSIPVLYGPIKGKDERRLAVRLFFVLNEKFARSELSSQEKAASTRCLSSFSSCYQRSEKEAVASGKKGRFGLPV